MRRIFSLALIIMLLFSMTACSWLDDSPRSEDGRIILTLCASYRDYNLTHAVQTFNENNEKYRIEFVDSAHFGGVTFADIYIFTGLGGIIGSDCPSTFINLYPYLDNDETYSRESFVPNLLEGMEQEDGSLYALPTSFQVKCLITDYPLSADNLSTDNIKEVAGDKPIFQVWREKEDLISLMAAYLVGSRVDTETSFCDFTDPELSKLLQLCKENEYDSSSQARQDELLTFNWLQFPKNVFTEKDKTTNQSQIINSIDGKSTAAALSVDACYAISTLCEHPDAAWDFITSTLETTIDYNTENFPSTWDGSYYDDFVTEENLKATYEFIANTKYVENQYYYLERILINEATKYFESRQSLEVTINNIQVQSEAWLIIHYGRQ